MTYDKPEKNKNNVKHRRFFVKFYDVTMDVDSFASFNVIFLGKNVQMRLPSTKKVPLCQSDLKIAHKNWIFSRYDIIKIQ